MKFETTALTLKNALSKIKQASSPKDQVLSQVAVKVRNGSMSLTCTDHQIRLSTEIEVSNHEDGQALLPMAKMWSLVSALGKDAPIKFSISDSGALIRSGRSRYKVNTLPFGDFPTVDDPDDFEALAVSGPQLHNAIGLVSHAMASNDVRFFLNGLLIDSTEERINIVATDGHRLSVSSVQCSSNGIRAILPRTSVIELQKLIGDSDVEMTIDRSSVRAQIGDVFFMTKLIDGRYPDYSKVIPDGGHNVCVVKPELLIDALRRAVVLSNEKYKGARLAFGENAITITANNPEHEEAVDVIDCAFKGEKTEIGVNITYLIDALSTIESEAVLKLTDGNSSIRIEDVDNPGVVHVVMPMRL